MANPLSSDELEFVQAIEKYKKEKGKLYPSWTEILTIVKQLGYVQSAQKKKTPGSTAKKKSRNLSGFRWRTERTSEAPGSFFTVTVAKEKGVGNVEVSSASVVLTVKSESAESVPTVSIAAGDIISTQRRSTRRRRSCCARSWTKR